MLTLGIVISLLLSALFSGSEIAYVSANKLKVELKKKRGGARSNIIAAFFDNPSRFLSTMLVGNNIVLVAFTSLMAVPLNALLIGYGGIESEGLLLIINTLVITVVVLIFGEFVPKALFRIYADDALYLFALPLRALQLLLLLPAWLLTGASDLLLRLFFKHRPTRQITAFTRLDLENLVNASHSEEEEEIDKELFGKALNLRVVRVRESMVPRTEIESIDVNASVTELEQLFAETKLSRLIITDGDINNVLGYVHHQQLFEQPQSISQLILEISFVPEVMRVADLMNKFIAEKSSIACVVDEFGGVSGLITLEDILEEIFGEIDDEYDEEEHIAEQLDPHTFRFSGRLEIDFLNENFGVKFPEGDYHTLSGYLVTTTGEIPVENESIEMGGYRFVVEAVSNTRIETVRVEKLLVE